MGFNMVKIQSPLMSLAASGDFAGTIQFVCGSFARMKPRTSDRESDAQVAEREKFLAGARKWSLDLSNETKKLWSVFRKIMVTNDECIRFTYIMTGYNVWMLYWLKFGEGGWVNYPNPPFS